MTVDLGLGPVGGTKQGSLSLPPGTVTPAQMVLDIGNHTSTFFGGEQGGLITQSTLEGGHT